MLSERVIPSLQSRSNFLSFPKDLWRALHQFRARWSRTLWNRLPNHLPRSRATSSWRCSKNPRPLALKEEALEVIRRVLPPGPASLSYALGNMIDICRKAGRADEAAAYQAELDALK